MASIVLFVIDLSQDVHSGKIEIWIPHSMKVSFAVFWRNQQFLGLTIT